jgi:6-pyruvoyltetrahydropterin/6-carboxytetrahydropterin synthase
VDPETGYLIDLKVLKAIIQERIIEPLDHKNLNTDVDFLDGVVPTAENIAVAVWNRLVGHIPSGRLYEVRIHETEHNVVWYRGEE